MVPAEALRRAEDRAVGLGAEVERLRAALDGTVPAARHEAALEDGRRAAAEAQRLAGVVEGMVPREQFLACQTRADQVQAHHERGGVRSGRDRERFRAVRSRAALAGGKPHMGRGTGAHALAEMCTGRAYAFGYRQACAVKADPRCGGQQPTRHCAPLRTGAGAGT